MRKIKNLFTCVGAQKSGTTWLAHIFRKHPNFVFGVHKEVHYFDYVHLGYPVAHEFRYEKLKDLCNNHKEDLIKYLAGDLRSHAPNDVPRMMRACTNPISDEWYLDMFENVKPHQYALDFSPEYALLGPRGFQHMRRLALNIKVLYIMRNPIERALSCMMHWEDRDLDKVKALSDAQIIDRLNEQRNVALTNYTLTVQHLKQSFSNDQLLFKFYDQLQSDSKQYLLDVLHFLDVSLHPDMEHAIQTPIYTSPKVQFSEEITSFLRKKYRDLVIDLNKNYFTVPDAWKEEFQL